MTLLLEERTATAPTSTAPAAEETTAAFAVLAGLLVECEPTQGPSLKTTYSSGSETTDN
jgi:hypothetical protein